jgi:UPF0489 domain
VLVLDIDLDLFVSPIKTHGDPNIRPTDAETSAWTDDEVRLWLETHCRLSASDPIPGMIAEEHVAAFDYLRSAVRHGHLKTPFDLVHADAHADFGMGTPAPRTVCTEVLANPPAERDTPRRGDARGLNSASWLAFAAACRWIRTLTYVHHTHLKPSYHDIPNVFLKGNDIAAAALQLKRLQPTARDSSARLVDLAPIALEPEIPLTLVAASAFRLEHPPSRLMIVHSPGYAPPKADRLRAVLERYVRIERA